MSNANNIPEEVMTVTLTLDDDSVVECEVITIYEAKVLKSSYFRTLVLEFTFGGNKLEGE